MLQIQTLNHGHWLCDQAAGGVGRNLLRLTVGLREGEEKVLEDGGKETVVVEWQEV